MSSIARWSYKNTALIRPFESEDPENGGVVYGDEYEIACTWAAAAKEDRTSSSSGSSGSEWVPAYVIWSEDARPKHRDLILLNSVPPVGWQEVRERMIWDMAMFDDTPDYRLVT